MDYIPIVDLSKVLTDDGEILDKDLLATSKEVFHALSGIGFVYLKNHGIKGDIVRKIAIKN